MVSTDNASASPSDPVAHPSHYSDPGIGVSCVQVAQAFNFNRGNAIKYIWRAGKKHPELEIEDLEKARQYLTFEIERLRKAQA